MLITSKNIAFYLRLSQEDMDPSKSNNQNEESISISNQRKLIDNFIKRRKEFSCCNITEYCDDGYTGTNFERPGFQQMLEDAKMGKIDTIILKDYSRLGRNFLGVGRYLEEIFPELKIRVISINDGYDSNNVIMTTDGIDIPIKNLINDFYVKDLSKKVKSGIITRQKKGECISANAIFGYKKSKENIHKLEIDEETAFIVRMVFDYALDGKNSVQIAKLLNEKQIMTPAWYKNKSDRRNYIVDNKTMWTAAKVMKILRDQRYAGDMVGNVRVTTKVAKSENIRVDRKEWIIVENTHEGIVPKEEFFKVNEEILPLIERNGIPLGDNRSQGFCYCPHCGRLLQKTNTTINPYFYCTRQTYDVDEGCMDSKIMVQSLFDSLIDMAAKYVEALINVDAFVKQSKIKIIQNHKMEMTAEDVEKEIIKLRQSTLGLHERYKDGKIIREAYMLQKRQANMKMDELKEKKLKICNGIGDKNEQEKWEHDLSDIINKFRDKKSFTERELLELIERVEIYSEKEIKVKWRFMDFTTKATEYLIRAQKIAS
ncbi:MAG: recombinase family protein [Lachnotalea sp.]